MEPSFFQIGKKLGFSFIAMRRKWNMSLKWMYYYVQNFSTLERNNERTYECDKLSMESKVYLYSIIGTVTNVRHIFSAVPRNL